ncbi:MAG: hypothetical protein BMS9Abin08_1628 [Gammaproteobacteria bacterium]|nr:MAG: hypothetical protein BMS9Abin08_1628 [Gammaproteobacteria bacterium]
MVFGIAMKRPHLFTVYLLLTGLAVGYLILAVWFPLTYIHFTYEDLYGEWGQTWLFLLAGLFSGWLATKPLPYRWFFLLLGIACLYTVLEEISWGQRLLGFESPYLFDQYNLQQETNIHNFFTGPFHTTTKNLVEALLVFILVAYGVFYPVLVKKQWSIAVWFEKKGIAPPPVYLWPFFLVAAPLEVGFFHFNEAEVAELLIGSAVLIFAMHYWFAARYQPDVYPQVIWDAKASGTFTKYLLLAFTGVVLGAVTTTQLLLNKPEARARIENRVLNGAEKFALRFQNRGQWQKAAEFYRLVYEADPSRTSVLRRLVDSYQAQGEKQNYRYYYRILLERSMLPGAANSNDTSVNLSLARSYQKIGDQAQSDYYLQRAYQLASQAVTLDPNSKEAVLNLARVQERVGRLVDAGLQYLRCVELDPGSEVCRAGAQRVQRLLDGADLN